MKLDVICLETEAYYNLIQEVIDIVKDQEQQEELWVDSVKAMSILKISSKTTLQKYRDENRIRFSQLSRKVILYYRPSLLELLENNVIEF